MNVRNSWRARAGATFCWAFLVWVLLDFLLDVEPLSEQREGFSDALRFRNLGDHVFPHPVPKRSKNPLLLVVNRPLLVNCE